MIISVNWLKKFTQIDSTIDELAKLIGSRLVEIESVRDLGKKYQGVVVAKVVECSPLEGSDHLNICKVDDGGVVEGVERDENGLVQVVCGAANVRAGLAVAWLPPGCTLPETFDDPNPVVLEARPLRGVVSNGMLASPREVGIGDAHEGILEIDVDAKPGDNFASVYELDDYLLDIENKSLTHRPDTFGIIGFAREVAAIQGKQFETPEFLRTVDPEWTEKSGNTETPQVTIDDPELSARFQAVVLTGVDAKTQSPLDVQSYLARIGMRPISAAVDTTNYMMMLTAQPLHAYDYDKLKAVNGGSIDIHVRAAREVETLQLLDGRKLQLSPDDIVITNGDTVVSLAGAMGGAETEIDENTTSILLESATFNLYNLRNTQMRHGIFSEAVTRDTKGQPAGLTAPVLAEAVRMMEQLAGAKRASDVADTYPGKTEPLKVYAMAEHMNQALGSQFTADDIVTTLRNVEFDVTVNDKGVIAAVAPYWRADIHISEDLDEEVGRLNGFDSINPTLPKRDFTAVSPDNFDRTRAKVRQILARSGGSEVLTYSFVHGDLLQKAGQKLEDSYRIVNSISPDLQYYRQSLMPSLLSLVHPNSKAGYDEFALFELNKTHTKTLSLDEDGLPQEQDHLGLVVASKNDSGGSAYYQAKAYLEYLAKSLGLQLLFEPLDAHPGTPNSAPFEYRRSAKVSILPGKDVIGIVGEFKTSVARSFKLPAHCAGFEIGSAELARVVQETSTTYEPLSRYPATERDICFQVEHSVLYAQVESSVQSALAQSELETSVAPVDLYQSDEGETKNITVRIRLVSHDKTLAADDVNTVVEAVVKSVTEATGATVI